MSEARETVFRRASGGGPFSRPKAGTSAGYPTVSGGLCPTETRPKAGAPSVHAPEPSTHVTVVDGL
jgi:hypothetical protein